MTDSLERIPEEVFRRAKARAALERVTIRRVLLARLQEYAAGYVTSQRDAKVAEAIEPQSAAEAIVAPPENPAVTAPVEAPDIDLGF